MDVYEQIAVKIVAGQETIIGPVAVEQAQQVPDIQVDWEHQKVAISGNKAQALETLINKYKELFGQISVEVCKEAAASLVGQLQGQELPEALK
jgi:hypothetical protein